MIPNLPPLNWKREIPKYRISRETSSGKESDVWHYGERVHEAGEVDHQAGVCSGRSGKVLGARKVKVFGKTSLGPTLGALGLKILLIEDTVQTEKIRARMTPRQRPIRKQQQCAVADQVGVGGSAR